MTRPSTSPSPRWITAELVPEPFACDVFGSAKTADLEMAARVLALTSSPRVSARDDCHLPFIKTLSPFRWHQRLRVRAFSSLRARRWASQETRP